MRASRSLAFLLACAVLAGCMGEDEVSTAGKGSRIDSAEGFSGEKREVAEVVERFEAAVLADDVETICRDLLAVEENRGYDEDNGGRDFCVVDPANQPDSMLSQAGGSDAYDLIVEKVRRDSAVHGRDRFRATVRGGDHVEELSIQLLDGEWQITSRDLTVDGDSTRLAGEYDCDKGGHAEIGVNYGGPRPRTADPRKAILLGPFGDKARNVLERGGSLELDSTFYRPDYHLMYALADKNGRIIVRFPVTVWGPRNFDTYSMTFCRDGQQGMIII